MRQLFLDKGALAIKEVCQPALDDHSVLVSVSYSFMSSGSGLAKVISERQQSVLSRIPDKVKKIAEIVAGKGMSYASLMVKDRLNGRVFNLGHSCSGVVVAVGKKVNNFRPGDFVACVGTDLANHADVVCVPQHLVTRIEDEKNVKDCSLAGIGAIALHSVQRAGLQLGQTVAVFGLESVGQITIKLCQASGCQVIGIDDDPDLLKLAQVAGVSSVYNNAHDNIAQVIDMFTNYQGLDCVIVTPDCEIKKVAAEAVRIVRPGGKIVFTGNTSVDFPADLACRKEIEILFATSYGPGLYNQGIKTKSLEQKTMATFIDLIADGRLDLGFLVNNEFSLYELSHAVDEIQQKHALGIVISYHQKKDILVDDKDNTESVEDLFTPARYVKDEGPVKVGVMGASRSTRLDVMPTLAGLDATRINTIVDLDISRSVNAARLYQGARALSGNLSLFRDDDSNVIFISDVADIDVDDVIALLGQGKAVFVERPFVDSFESLDKLESFLKKHPQSALCIGYSRRYSSFIQKIKKQLDRRKSPFMLQYHVNMGTVSQEERFSGAWRFGGVVARASHILDLFYYLSGSKPNSVSVEALRMSNDSSFATDNFVAQVSFADGSVCSLTFTSLGDEESGKEQMEIFFDSKTIIMKDFTNLVGYGVASYFDEKDKEADFGREELIRQYFAGIAKDKKIVLPISLEEQLVSTKLMLTVDQMVCNGGG